MINNSFFLVVFLPVWRVNTSPFACNLLDVTLFTFCTLPITLQEIKIKQLIYYCIFLRIYLLKMPCENAGNGISEPLNLKNVRGRPCP